MCNILKTKIQASNNSPQPGIWQSMMWQNVLSYFASLCIRVACPIKHWASKCTLDSQCHNASWDDSLNHRDAKLIFSLEMYVRRFNSILQNPSLNVSNLNLQPNFWPFHYLENFVFWVLFPVSCASVQYDSSHQCFLCGNPRVHRSLSHIVKALIWLFRCKS